MIPLNFRPLLLCAIGACLAGCSLIPKFGLNTSSAPPPPVVEKPVRSIAIVHIAEPQSEQILTVGSALGSSTNTTLSQPRADYSNTYTQLLESKKTLFAPELVKALTDMLTASGYQVTYLPTQKAFPTADGKSEDLAQVHTDADAILVIRFTGAGYVSSPLELSYQPWVTLSAHLIRASNKQDIYLKTFSGGYPMTAASSVSLPSSSQYRYPYFRDLTAAADESIRGLKQSVNDIATYLGKDLFQGAAAVPLPVPPADPIAPQKGGDAPAAIAAPKSTPAPAPADSKHDK